MPSISYKGKEYNLSKIKISTFMESTVINLLNTFELMMVYLCDLHTEPFADEKRVIIQIPENERQESEKHVGFKYQILYTK